MKYIKLLNGLFLKNQAVLCIQKYNKVYLMTIPNLIHMLLDSVNNKLFMERINSVGLKYGL